MSTYANAAILDNADTPEAPGTPGAATRTFVPGGKENGVYTWYENTTGTTAATRSKITLSITPGKEVTRVKATLALPKAVTANGITTVSHVTRVITEYLLPNNGSRDDRKDAKTLMKNFLDSACPVAAVSELEGVAA